MPERNDVDGLRGRALLADSLHNKSSAFTAEERSAFGLDGLLPPVVSTMAQQVERVYASLRRKESDLEKYIGLMALEDRNETLFYRLLREHLAEFLPIVYTPTVGEASKMFSHIFQRGRGLWVTPEHRGRIAEVLANAERPRVRLAVVTDNQAILGIGDQGAGGIVIPIGKLSIYCAAAGIHPGEVLPISLDVGTDNEALIDDPLYLGWRRPRLRGDAYLGLVDEFVEAMNQVFPGALLQWEDFSKANAFALLERHRSRILSFNDDIQGTGAMALAGIVAACRASGEPLTAQRTVIVGAGAAGIGIARQLRNALAEEGLGGQELTEAIAVLDSRGLVTDDRERLDAYKRALAWPAALAARHGLHEDRSLPAVVRQLRPTLLIGTSGQADLFDEPLMRSVAAHAERPIVLPLSNPTDHSEARPADILRWTDGRAFVGTGSPFPDVDWEGRSLEIGQANNAFIFPGVGLGALLAGASEVSDGMFSAAATALAEAVTSEDAARGRIYPPIERLREVTRSVAVAVMVRAGEEGVASPITAGEAAAKIEQFAWEPTYPDLLTG